MRGVWGSLIFFVLVFVLTGATARADYWDVTEYAPLPIGVGEYSPPAALNDCEVAVAGSNVTTVASCLPRPSVSSKGGHFVFDDERRAELERVNAEFNSVLADSTVSLEEGTQVAVGKMMYLLELSWPSSLLSYGIVELAEGDERYNVVVLVVFNTRAFALDSRKDRKDIIPWQLYPHRFVGVESNGTWRPVADDRDDPSYSEMESHCGEHVCERVVIQ